MIRFPQRWTSNFGGMGLWMGNLGSPLLWREACKLFADEKNRSQQLAPIRLLKAVRTPLKTNQSGQEIQKQQNKWEISFVLKSGLRGGG